MDRLRFILTGFILLTGLARGAQTGMVAGFIRDASSGEFLSYANCYLDGTSIG